MDFFDDPNYRISKILLSLIGQWPYQSPVASTVIIIVLTIITCWQIFAKICGMFIYVHNMSTMTECLIPLMINTMSILKVANYMVYINEFRALFDRIKNDFDSLKNSSDIEILREHAIKGKKYAIIYSWTWCILGIIFTLVPLKPLIHLASNASRPLIHKVEYYIDMEKYYWPIVIHAIFTIVVCIIAIVATDTTFMMLVQHVCGLISVINVRMKQAIRRGYSDGGMDSSITEDKGYQNMVRCIRHHAAVVRFVDLMEVANCKHFLIYAGINMLALSITGVGILAKMDDTGEVIRLVIVTLWVLLSQLFLECFFAQKIIDYSERLRTNLITLNWYDASHRTQRLVVFMMIKMQSPCALTAGGMFVLCMQTFATIVKTAVSYFTFLRSAQ